MKSVQHIKVDQDEAGMRLDRWFKLHYPGLGFGALQKLLRSGQVRIDGKRVKSDTRVQTGQNVRVPPLDTDARGKADQSRPLGAGTMRATSDTDLLRKITLYEDDHVLVVNKPSGLAVQGGSGVVRHIDKMLASYRNKRGEKPRLVHRLDRDTSGVLAIARTRSAAVALTKYFRERETQKVYWALVKGVPKRSQGKLSTYLVKEQRGGEDRMRIARHGEIDAEHAVSTYRVVERSGNALSWLELIPETGRTHQLRVHCLYLDCPILGDVKYFEADQNWVMPGGIQNRLHLHARRLVIPHPKQGVIDVTADLPPHMVQSWNLLGLDTAAGDPEASP